MRLGRPRSAPVTRWLPGADDAASSPLPRIDTDLPPLLAEPAEDPAYDLPPAWALPACARVLRSAGEELAALSWTDRARGLDRVARSWLDPDDAFRREALERVAPECGLGRGDLAAGLDAAFSAASFDQFGSWWRREGGPRSASLSGHVWAGNVVTAGLPPVFASVLAGVPALIKAPSAFPSFAALFARSVALHAPELGPCVGAAAWPRQDARATEALVAASDRLFVFGSDATVAGFEGANVARFGHRLSVGWIAEERPDFAGLAADVLAWNSGGCLTPRWIFVLGDADRAEALAREAAPHLAEEARKRGAPPLGDAPGADRAAWLAKEGFAGWSDGGAGWAVAARRAPELSPDPPPRAAVFLPIGDPGELLRRLEPVRSHLQGLAVAAEDADLALRLGVSRAASFGQLQRPPVHWNHDDVRVLASLC